MSERRLISVRLSLRQLFIYLTVICIVSGAVTQYPDTIEAIAQGVRRTTIAAFVLVPTFLVCRSYAFSSRSPKLTFFVTVIGACIGVFFCPGLSANLKQVVFWFYGFRWNGLQPIGIIDVMIPPVAAILVGGIGGYFINTARSPSTN